MKRPRTSPDAMRNTPKSSQATDPFLPVTAVAAAQASAAATAAAAAATSPRRTEAASVALTNSPYGSAARRNGAYGWGNLFQAPIPATLDHLPNVHIGISSLNAVPRKGSPSMTALLSQYRRKFRCLEHCYPYHRVGEPAVWASWAGMVRDSSSPSCSETAKLWSETSPPLVRANRFIYTVKANSLLTHTKQAAMDAELEAHVDLFFGKNCRQLGPFLGPVLVQFPPFFQRSAVNVARLERLAGRLPHDTVDYVAVTDSDKVNKCFGVGNNDTTATVTDVGPYKRVSSIDAEHLLLSKERRQRIRIAVEFRHRSWHHPETFALLRRLGWSLVVAHHHNDATFANHIDTGTDFMYVRLHGPQDQHVGDYGPERMRRWAEVVASYLTASGWNAETREVFFFLNNSDSHVAGTTSSTVDATCLAEELGRLLPPPSVPRLEKSESVRVRSASAKAGVGVDDNHSHALDAPGREPLPGTIEDSDSTMMATAPVPHRKTGGEIVVPLASIVDVDADSNSCSVLVLDE